MSKVNVQKSIASLRNEVAHLGDADASVQAKMLALIEDLEQQMQDPQASAQADALQKIPTLIEQFESDHPKLTNTLGDLLATLSSMGV